jgi:hypothetical protein
MPICRVGRSRYADTRDDGTQWIGAVTCPQRHSFCIEVNIICEVIPVAGFKLRGPFCYSANTPAQCIVFTGRVAAKQAVL